MSIVKSLPSRRGSTSEVWNERLQPIQNDDNGGLRALFQISRGHSPGRIRSGEYVAGDEAPFTGDNVVTVRVPYMKRGEKLRITDGEGVLKEMTAKKSGGIAVSVTPRTKGAFFAEVVSGYRGVKRLAFDILLSFMLPEDAFRRHPEFTFALSAPIYFV